ncbi:MAG: translation initiation factor [Mangrovibacterium sp.]
MAKENDWKERLGMVYSTNPGFQFEHEDQQPAEPCQPKQQNLRVELDRKGRNGKAATIITGFVGTEDGLKELSRKLKTKLGVGGSTRDGEILVQGDFATKVIQLLQAEGYNVKRIGG